MDALSAEIVELTSRLIERPSVTPDDAGCQRLLKDLLAEQGFTTEDLPSADVQNFWAVHGTGAPVLVFAGHTDVVPTGPVSEWRFDPFSATVADQRLFGRGSADMKGSLAAMIVATRRFLAAQPDHAGSIAYLVTSDEEGVATDGTVKVVDWLEKQNIRPEFCLVGEPSSTDKVGDVIRIGRRGSLNGTLTVHGIQGHVAYPDLASNPIHNCLTALQALCERRWDSGNSAFPPTSFQISNIHSGTGATNVIPGSLTAQFNFRYCTEQTAAGLMALTRQILDGHKLEYSIDWAISGEPFQTASAELINAVGDSVASVQGFVPEASTGGGTSDGRFIARLGTQIVELGPVNATIHSVDEHVLIADLKALSDIYLGVLQRLLGPGNG